MIMTSHLTGQNSMRTVQASEAKAQFLRLLDDVEQGETVTITRHGRAVARLVPQSEADSERRSRAIASILAIRKRTKPVSLTEILAARDEGRM